MNTDISVSTWQAELAVDSRCTLGEGPQSDCTGSPPLPGKAATISLIIWSRWPRRLKAAGCC